MILNGISVSVPSGKTVALVGPSGCGKSTIVQLMERYYDVLSGALVSSGKLFVIAKWLGHHTFILRSQVRTPTRT
jgi:ABC-type transport system involved in cytochrome bd biosynthesis fused ATPase/permease subunit